MEELNNTQPEIQKPIIKKWWFWVVAVIVLGGLFVAIMSTLTSDANKDDSSNDKNKGKSSEENQDIVATFTPESNAAFQYNPPTIIDNYIYIGTSTRLEPKGSQENLDNAPDNFFYKLDLDFKEIWKYELKKLMVGGAAVLDSEGNIYFTALNYKYTGSKEGSGYSTDIYLYSIDRSGQFRWKKLISAPNEAWDHAMNNLAVGKDDTIYAGDAKFYAFDKSGQEKWHYPADDKKIVGYRSAPSIDRAGNIYFWSPEPSKDNGNDQLALYKFSPGSSSPAWTKKITKAFLIQPDGSQAPADTTYSVPAFSPDDTTVYVVNGNTVFCLSASDGATVWSYKPEGVEGVFKANPAIDKDGNLYVGSKANEQSVFYAIKADGSGLLWKNEVGADLYPSPIIGDDGRVYFGSEGLKDDMSHFHSADLKTGEYTWHTGYDKYPMSDISFSSPALLDGYIYLGGFSQETGAEALYKIKVNAKNYQSGAYWPRFHGSNTSNGRSN